MVKKASFRRLTSAGDTIVEVLVAIAIASAALGSSFVVVNRTFNNARQAQEHEEALKLTEGQLERLKDYLKDPTHAIPAADFCFDTAGGLNNSPPCTLGIVPGGYRLATHELPATGSLSGEHLFRITANWDGPTGNTEQVSVLYKVYR